MRTFTVIWFCFLYTSHATVPIDDAAVGPNVSHAIQRSANRSKWRSQLSRQLQTTPTFAGFTTKRSELCVSHGNSVTRPEVEVPSSLELCSYCRGPELDPCIYDVSECSGISQGRSCRIRCKVPYLGASREALCPFSGSSAREENLSFTLPTCLAALEQDQVSCPNPSEIPTGYRQLQETGEWVCGPGYYGQALRECTLLRVADSCLLQAVFSGCSALVGCRAPNPATDYPEGLASDVPACGYDIRGCENVQHGQSCQIGCTESLFSGAPVTARCPDTNTDPNQKLIYTVPSCQKICPSPSVQEAGPGYFHDLFTDHWTCTSMYTGQAVKSCNINEACERTVEMIGCLPLMPCAAPTLDPCRYDWSSCGDFFAGVNCEIACRTPYEGDGFPTFCPANNSNQTTPLQFEIPWCALSCVDPLPLPDGYIRSGSDYKCNVGYTGFAERTCTVKADCSYEVTFNGCSKLLPCKALPALPAWPEPGNRCELDISDCQQPVPLGGSCQAKCRAPFTGMARWSDCPSRNTDPERTVDFRRPFCSVESCPEPIPVGYAKTSNGYTCAPGYGGTVLSSCTTCGRLVLTGCYTAIPCKPFRVQDNCLRNVSDCSSPISAGDTCTITCGNAYEGEPTIARCPADNIDPQGDVVAVLPQCSLYCPDPDPVPLGYDIFVDYLGRREIRCAQGYVGQAKSKCLLLQGCRSELQLTGCMKLEPCQPLTMLHAERYEMPGCEQVLPGSSCTISCKSPWTGAQAIASCPANNIDPNQPLILPEEILMNRHGIFYNNLWPPRCSLRCDSVPVGYEKVQGGRWRCAPGFHGNVAPKTCTNRGQCKEALQLEGCSELIPCTLPNLDACLYDVSDCGGFQRGTSCEVKCRAPYNGTSTVVQCPINNTDTTGGLVGDLPDCVIEECADPDVIPAGYVPIDAANGLWSCAPGFTGEAQKLCVAESTSVASRNQARLDQYGLEQPTCAVRGFLDGCVVAEPCAEFVIQDSCMFAAPSCNAAVSSQGLIIPSLSAGQSCEVECKAPYKAKRSTVTCPATNTNTSVPSVWEALSCVLDCPDVDPPVGIEAILENSSDSEDEVEWRCSDGFIGTASRICRLLDDCQSETIFSGCSRLLPCRAFATDLCGVNGSSCQSLQPAESCQITCGQGHVGGPFSAECPAGNTLLNRALQFAELPTCTRIFPMNGCYQPFPWPEGYMRNNSVWSCAEGYVGIPIETCVPMEPCGQPIALSGCEREQPCKTLALDSCRYEAVGCSGLMGGEACEIRCKAPAEGDPVLATCPEENVNPEQELIYTLPTCTIPTCPNPSPITTGYVEEEIENGTSLACAEKFAGNPQVVCIFTNDCQPLARLEGCNPLLACVGPAELDDCKYSVNLCEDGPLQDVPGGNDGYRTVKPGGRCEVSCRGRFVGSSTVGICPLNNTDPFQRLIFDPPAQCDCPDDLEEWPEGYNQTGVISNTGPLQDGAWYCEDGYGGTPQVTCNVLTGCVPEMVFDGCAPLQRCGPMNMSNPPCQFDISACNRSLDGGENCEVTCRLPAVGLALNASCPEDNTVPNQELMTAEVDPMTGLVVRYRAFEFPDCVTPSFCPDPVPMTVGYYFNRTGVEGGDVDGNYWCDEGFSESPQVKRTCEMVNSTVPGVAACLLYPVFDGCLPIVNCSGIDERMVDTCRYDVSRCPETFEPGETCEVTCREPFYTGSQSAYASCPIDNTDPNRQIIVAASESLCAKACPEVEPVPVGYEKVNGQWQCSAGYLGTPVADCEVMSIFSSVTRSAVCEARVGLSGCELMSSCLPPTLDACIYDVSDCRGVLSGTNCSLKCRSPPYEGIASNASCPNGNLDPMRVVDFLPPNCSLRCPPPAAQEELPNGYNYTDGVYVCLDGWFGSANAECIVSEDCTFGVSLTGCGQSSPCLGLNESAAAGSCYFDVSPRACSLEDDTFPQANFGRGPGGTCTVSCRPPCSPQEGEPFFETLTCPASNLNAQLPLQGTLPNCSFDCDPLDRGGGYSKGATGDWTCAEGFAGEVVPLCWSGEVCEDQMMLTGCLPEQPCVAPVITVTPCVFDTSSCQGVPAGGSCFVGCTSPYYLGSVRPAYCSGNNTDPLGPAELAVRPVCNWNPAETCPDPTSWPTGYAFDLETGTWICAPGFAGEAMRNCALRPVSLNSQSCIPEAVLSGCFPLTPCIEPQTNDCKFNTTAAANLTPGSIGLIYCNVPYDGVPTQAQCPWDNNQPGQEPMYGWPVCEPACPKAVGQPTPPGFIWIEADKEWQCLPGYRAPAEVNCTTNIACEWMLDYGGCEQLERCADLNISSCVVDTNGCNGLDGGESCTVSCIAPFYVGSSTTASCPFGNIDPDRLPDLIMPNCEVTCPDPSTPPAGYEKANASFGAWQCAAGYSGTANKSCHTSSFDEGCVTTTVLTGCLPIVPCKDPDPRTQPPCYYDTSACFGVMAGSSCSIPCLSPYVGTVGSASCAVNNTNPWRPLVWDWPECSLDPCPDPPTIPVGYLKETGGNWSCADGFVGSASISCVASPIEPGAGVQCNVSSLLSGCLGKMPCAELPLDACMLDSSNCSGGIQAGGSCDVLCKYPYVGTPGEALCPEINTDAGFLPTLRSPMCMVDCSQLESIERIGYKRKSNDTGSGWECDSGYSGIVQESCFLQFDGSSPCGTPELLLSGCRPLVDCVAPMVDLCQFDVSLCQAVVRGSSCEISCRLPYTGTSKVASCPSNNTDALQGLQVDLPSCSFPTCPDPATLPLGYVLHSNGTYGCDQDYIGTVVRRCSAFSPLALGNAAQGPECYTEAVFSGCKVIAEIVPCQPPVLNPCLQSASSCMGSALDPGGTCQVECRLPFYKGTASTATCPLDNINTTGGLEWTPPQCSLWCPEPTLQEEPAYGRNPEGGSSQDSSGWICNPGYTGTAQVFCQLLPPVAGALCGVARLQMSGCSRLEPCVPLLAATLNFQVRLPAPPPSRDFVLASGDGFELQVSPSCAALSPGEACLIGCRWPFVGQVVIAQCPVGNTDRFQVPVLDAAPFCDLRCPDPEGPAPMGYRPQQNAPGEWQCTPDYTGDPLKYCNASAGCNESAYLQLDSDGSCANAVELEISFSGCQKRQPCTGPDLSSCQMESFDCPAILQPGASCEVQCRFPFVGSATFASCPRDNTLMDGHGLVWQAPTCTLPECYDPVPPGYQFSDGWTCSQGYNGTAKRSCSTDKNCEEEIVLTGCQQLQTCRIPSNTDRCRYDYSSCRSTLDGNTCEIRCLSPFYTSAQVGQARCPAGNVNPNQELEVVVLPICEPVCDQQPPPGYIANSASNWRCADGYLGTAQASCTITDVDGSCTSSLSFSGCLQRTPCASPRAKADGCIYELQGCDEITAGSSSCEIGCKHPYRGSSAVATCPADNTDPSRPADVTLPECVVKAPCPDPPDGVPAAYRYTGNVLSPVACASGYYGPNPSRQCVAKPLPDSNNTCFAEGEFSGCEPIVPCVAPSIPSTDCEVEHNCPETLPAGSSCEIRCRRPLVGAMSVARCPWNNTKPMKVADWTPPVCTCPDPELIPPGYQAAAGDDWTCLAGYVGRAQKVCPCGGDVSILMGCHSPIICGAAGFTDTDTRKGFIGGDLKFGPSTIDQRTDEDGVYRYEVFWADDCGVTLSSATEPILSLPPRTSGGLSMNLWPSGCCKTDVYIAALEPLEMPSDARSFVIQVLTTSGPAPDALVVPVVDESYDETVTNPPKGTVGSASLVCPLNVFLLLGVLWRSAA